MSRRWHEQKVGDSTLIDHTADGFPADYGQVVAVPVPLPTEDRPRWRPFPYADFLETTDGAFRKANLQLDVQGGKYALTHGGLRMFGVLPIIGSGDSTWTGAAAVRASYDSSFAVSISFGQKVQICTNLCVWGEVRISARCTENAEDTLWEKLTEDAQRYFFWLQAMEAETKQMRQFHPQSWEVSHLMVESVRRGIVPGSMLAKVIEEHKAPRHGEFSDGSAWSLFNCYTEVAKERSPQQQFRMGSPLLNLFREHFLVDKRNELTAAQRAAVEDMEREFRLAQSVN